MASAALTTSGASPRSCVSTPEGPTSLSSLASVSALPLLPSGFSTSPAWLAPPIPPVAQPKCRQTVQQQLRRQRFRLRINSLCRHHTSPSHRPASVTRTLVLLSPLLRLRDLSRCRRRCCGYRYHHCGHLDQGAMRDGLHILTDLSLDTISPSVPAIPSSRSSPSPQ